MCPTYQFMLNPETVAVLRCICAIADRARNEVRYGDRDWWRQRCQYALADLAPSFGYVGHTPKERGNGLCLPYIVSWVRNSALNGVPIGKLELIIGFDEPDCEKGITEFTALVHARSTLKLWLAWHPTLISARAAHSQIGNWANIGALGVNSGRYLLFSVIRERKRLFFSTVQK